MVSGKQNLLFGLLRPVVYLFKVLKICFSKIYERHLHMMHVHLNEKREFIIFLFIKQCAKVTNTLPEILNVIQKTEW